MTLPDGLPREIRHGLTWVICAWVLATQLGFEAPWQLSTQVRDEWVKAHAAATATIEAQGRSIVVLQDRDARTQDELRAIRGKLDDMSMVLYSLERRSR